MKRLTSLLLVVLLFGMAQGVWAEPREEVIRVWRQWFQVFNEGNLEALVALYTDDAHFFPALAPFRVEGKEAIRGAFARTFEAFPTHRAVPSHESFRVYGDAVVASTAYGTLTLVDRKGEARILYLRVTRTYVKQGGKWLLATHHVSRLPVSP